MRSALGPGARQNISLSAVVKCKRVLDISNETPPHSLRSFVNHFQRQNHQGNLPF